MSVCRLGCILLLCARVFAAGATAAHASTWSTLSGYQCSGGTLGGQNRSLAAAKLACVDNPRCSGVYDVGCDGRKGFALCDASSAVKKLAGSCVHELVVRVSGDSCYP